MPPTIVTPTPLMTLSMSTKPVGMVPEKYKGYIGLTFPPLPDNITEGFGTLITPAEMTDWLITAMTNEKDTMLWLSKMARNGNTPKWQVSDILLLSNLTKNEVLVPNGCKKDEVDDPEIIAIADVSPEAYSLRHVESSSIRVAWRANRKSGVFQEVVINNSLECYLDNAFEVNNPTLTPQTP